MGWPLAVGAVGFAAVTAVVVVLLQPAAVPARNAEAGVPARPSAPAEPEPSPSPQSSTPSDVLQGAAIAALEFAPPALEPGEYLRRSWTTVELNLYEDALGSGTPGMGGDRTTATSGWLVSRTGTDYVPYDLSGDWYGITGPAELGELFGDVNEATLYGDAYVDQFGAGLPLQPQAVYVPWSAEGVEDIDAVFASMPRETEAMVAWISERLGSDAERWSDGGVGDVLIGLLSYNVGPPDLRAAMYRTLSTLEASSSGEESAGRRTVTFASLFTVPGEDAPMHTRQTMTIDMTTGMVLETTYTLDVAPGVVPSDVPDIRRTYSTSVVDSLP